MKLENVKYGHIVKYNNSSIGIILAVELNIDNVVYSTYYRTRRPEAETLCFFYHFNNIYYSTDINDYEERIKKTLSKKASLKEFKRIRLDEDLEEVRGIRSFVPELNIWVTKNKLLGLYPTHISSETPEEVYRRYKGKKEELDKVETKWKKKLSSLCQKEPLQKASDKRTFGEVYVDNRVLNFYVYLKGDCYIKLQDVLMVTYSNTRVLSNYCVNYFGNCYKTGINLTELKTNKILLELLRTQIC